MLKIEDMHVYYGAIHAINGVSFEVGATQLGGTALFLSTSDIQLGRGEPISDTAQVLSRMVDGIMIRTFKQSDLEALAKYGSIRSSTV